MENALFFQELVTFLSQPWHWSVSGVMIVLVMVLLLWAGGEFGVSSNLRTLCAMAGADKHSSFFNFNWKGQIWNLVFILGAVIGGFVAFYYLPSTEPVQISATTQTYLKSVGISTPTSMEEGAGFVPKELFTFGNSSIQLIILVLGGFLVGFGTRWAGGCTSGHAISGLSNLQVPSLIAVIGFFIGGLVMTFFILPVLLQLI